MTYSKYFLIVYLERKKVMRSCDNDDLEGETAETGISLHLKDHSQEGREGRYLELSVGIYINLKGKDPVEAGKGQGTVLRKLFFLRSG